MLQDSVQRLGCAHLPKSKEKGGSGRENIVPMNCLVSISLNWRQYKIIMNSVAKNVLFDISNAVGVFWYQVPIPPVGLQNSFYTIPIPLVPCHCRMIESVRTDKWAPEGALYQDQFLLQYLL